MKGVEISRLPANIGRVTTGRCDLGNDTDPNAAAPAEAPVAPAAPARFDMREKAVTAPAETDNRSVVVPAGLTFSPRGLSKPMTSRFIADI
jgi:hypothetical protein